MAVTFRTLTGYSAAADTAAPFASLTYTLPTGHTTNDLLVAFYAGKPYNTVPGTPTDYTARSGAADGTTAMGNGTGSTYSVAFTKEHTGSESNPSSTFSAQYSPGMTAMLAATSDAGVSGWTVTSTDGSDTTATGTGFSATGGATLTLTTGDYVIVMAGGPDNGATPSSITISVPGCTLDTVVVHGTPLSTATGNDGWMYVATALVLSGTSSGAPTTTATVGSGDSSGHAVFLAVTEPVSNDKTGTVAGALPSFSGTVVGTKKTTGTAAGSMSFGGTVVGTKFEGSNDKTGTVTGAIALTGTATGAKATTGTVIGAVTLSGTEVGAKGGTGAVTGSLTITGTADGLEGRTAAVAGQITLAGTVTGTADDPNAPAPAPNSAPRGGGLVPRHIPWNATSGQTAESHSGHVRGGLAIAGNARGTKGTTTSARAHLAAPRLAMRGIKHATATTYARMELRGTLSGLHHAGTPTEQRSRRADEDDLLLLMED